MPLKITQIDTSPAPSSTGSASTRSFATVFQSMTTPSNGSVSTAAPSASSASSASGASTVAAALTMNSPQAIDPTQVLLPVLQGNLQGTPMASAAQLDDPDEDNDTMDDSEDGSF